MNSKTRQDGVSAGRRDHGKFLFWRTYVFSTDHKIIGLQYGVTALLFLLFGFLLMVLMRWQLAFPGQRVPVFGALLERIFGGLASGGVISADLYYSFTTMHGTIMVFLGVVPLGFAAFGNYLVPLQIGAPDMAFPRLNMASYQFFLVGGITLLASFFLPDGTARSGWTSYSPLAETWQSPGQVMLLTALVFLATSSVLGSVNFIATIIQLRAPGMNWVRLPFFVWAQLVTAFLLLLAFPPLEVAAILQLSDALLSTSFFIPAGFSGTGASEWKGGGSPLLWQHLFWFLAHPEVYVLLLPGLGIVTEIIACNTRKPISGYYAMVSAAVLMGVLSMLVWGHHMFVTGMGTKISAVFQTTTMMVSIPSVVILTVLLVSLWGGSIRFNTPMLFSLAFLPMFGLGGLTGLPLGFNLSNLQLHDSYYVIAHFHYIVAPGTIFALFAGIYHWYPKLTGRLLSDLLGKIHFWPSLIFMNLIFLPMFFQGMAGMSRRLVDGGGAYVAPPGVGGALTAWHVYLNLPISNATWFLGAAQIPFVINLFWSWQRGQKVTSDNPWEATTLEWQTPTPPPHGNFAELPLVHRGPYEYSVPECSKDFCPQNEKECS